MGYVELIDNISVNSNENTVTMVVDMPTLNHWNNLMGISSHNSPQKVEKENGEFETGIESVLSSVSRGFHLLYPSLVEGGWEDESNGAGVDLVITIGPDVRSILVRSYGTSIEMFMYHDTRSFEKFYSDKLKSIRFISTRNAKSHLDVARDLIISDIDGSLCVGAPDRAFLYTRQIVDLFDEDQRPRLTTFSVIDQSTKKRIEMDGHYCVLG